MKRLLFTFALLLVLGTTLTRPAAADSVSANFEIPFYFLFPPNFPINGQQQWSNLGSVGSGCAFYDARLAPIFGVPSFGHQSLRISNGIASGCFDDQTFSKPVVDEAGEAAATDISMIPGGTRQKYFEFSVDFLSVQPSAEQPGLSVVLSPVPYRRGARMSWIQIADASDGLQVNFYDYNAAAGGFAPNPTNVISGLDRTVPHNLRVTLQTVPGRANDQVRVYVDGVFLHQGGSWEDYFRDNEDGTTRTVDSVLFRTSVASLATLGKGLYFDNYNAQSNVGYPVLKDDCKNGGWQAYGFPNQGQCVASLVSKSPNH